MIFSFDPHKLHSIESESSLHLNWAQKQTSFHSSSVMLSFNLCSVFFCLIDKQQLVNIYFHLNYISSFISKICHKMILLLDRVRICNTMIKYNDDFRKRSTICVEEKTCIEYLKTTWCKKIKINDKIQVEWMKW